MYKVLKSNWIISGLIFLLLGLIIFWQLPLLFSKTKPQGPIPDTRVLVELVENRMANCVTEGSKAPCFKDLTKTLVNYDTVSVLSVFEKNENSTNFYSNCHETLHFFGSETYEKSKNISESLLKGNSVCFSGYYHGVLESYFKNLGVVLDGNNDEIAKQQVPQLCVPIKQAKTLKDYHECLHGLGHALMFLTEEEVPRSLQICDTIPEKADKGWCYSGVFMENSTSSTNKEHPSKYLKANDPLYPCNALPEQYLNACYSLQSFYFAKLVNFDWEKTIQMCYKIPADYQLMCFSALGQVEVGATSDLNQIHKKCQGLSSGPTRQSCIEGVVGALGQRFNNGAQRSSEFCQLHKNTEADYCFAQVYSLMLNWFSGSEKLTEYCLSLPSLHRTPCLEKIKEPL